MFKRIRYCEKKINKYLSQTMRMENDHAFITIDYLKQKQ